MPVLPEGHRATVVPDWVCEILSPSTESVGREITLPIYARFGVAHAWLLDPRARSLEAYAQEGGAWREIARHGGGERVRVPPFDAVEIDLADLWMPAC